MHTLASCDVLNLHYLTVQAPSRPLNWFMILPVQDSKECVVNFTFPTFCSLY
jgi:hypothetical protein